MLLAKDRLRDVERLGGILQLFVLERWLDIGTKKACFLQLVVAVDDSVRVVVRRIALLCRESGV